MKFNKWTVGLAAAGVVSLASAVQAEEAKSAVQTLLSGTTLSGYVDTSASWRFGTGTGILPGRAYDGADKQDGFNLNVVKVTIEKALDEGQWAAGYKVDMLYGPDANTFNSLSAQSSGTPSDFAIKQAYVALRAPVGNGLDFKLGVWDTIIGYEVFDAGNNPNYSRSYGYFLEPTTYTGLLTSYRFTDWLSVSGGVADASGASATINSRSTVESRKSYMASIALTAPESMGALKGSTLYVGFVDGNNDGPPASAVTKDQLNFYAGATVNTGVTGLAVGVAYDYVANGVADSSFANAIALYGSFQATEKMKLNIRGDYTTASQGTYATSGGSGGHQKYLALTSTVDYSLWANVISRVEFRWDHDAAGNDSFGGQSNGDSNAYTLALNLIYKF